MDYISLKINVQNFLGKYNGINIKSKQRHKKELIMLQIKYKRKMIML